MAVDVLPYLEAQAKERQKRKPADSVTQKVGEQNKHICEATHQAAALFHTNRQYVADAKVIKAKLPEFEGKP